MFCGCDNDSRKAEPNTNICPVCLGYPGSLPTVNQKAIEYAIKLGLGLNAKIAKDTKFDRKNYFYPDLPKGYQISQYDMPIVHDGYVEILVEGEFRKIGVERAHLEEDAAKLIHPKGVSYSLVDYNRGGTPLVEIVSKPDIHSAAEARRYLAEVYNIAMSLGITDGNMEEGNFKFDLNISLSDTEELGAKVELKNLNSFRYAEKALNYEIKRQTELLEKGEVIEQETRGYDDMKGITFSQRSKEEAHDYRYFPEPDLPPLQISEAQINDIKKTLPLLPIEIRKKLADLQVGVDDQDLLIGQPNTLVIFEGALTRLDKPELIKKAVNWLVGDYQSITNGKESKLTGENLAELIVLVEAGTISSKTAKEIFASVINGVKPSQLVEKHGHAQISDEAELAVIIQKIIEQNPQAQADYKAGKENAQKFLIGQVMKETHGQANPSKVADLMRKYL